MPLEVIVTGGGTISKVDDVRHIGNFSRGTTAARIAQAFLRSGAIVHYLHSRDAVTPWQKELKIDPQKPFELEVEKAEKAYREFTQHEERYHDYEFQTFDEYYDAVRDLLTSTNAQAIILAAAVSDYGVLKQEGKISSEHEVMALALTKNPKVISKIKEWNPHIFQVGFKLLADAGIEELIDIAYAHGIKNKSNLTVANAVIGGDFGKRITFFITPEKGITPVTLEELAGKLVETVSRRVSSSHYRTEKVEFGDMMFLSQYLRGGEPDEFRKAVQKFWKLNLFPPYLDGAKKHFGFVAMRMPYGFLITARGSDKEELPDKDIVYVPQVDFHERIIHVAPGKKASLNANVAARIFKEMPDVDLILHAHIFPGVENRTSHDYAPGTREDEEEVLKYLSHGEKIVELVNHGIIALGKKVEDIKMLLGHEHTYRKFPELYDITYGRFQHADEMVQLVQRNVSVDEHILDLAAGTGEVAWQLLQKGYKNVALADKHEGMLEVAQRKIKKISGTVLPHYIANMKDMALREQFDAIVVRQGINYLMDIHGLREGLRNIYEHLLPGGRLIINALHYQGEEAYEDNLVNYQDDAVTASIREMNFVEGRMLTHTQNGIMYHKDGSAIQPVYDLNTFGLFTPQEFSTSLREAGFAEVLMYGKGLEPLRRESKAVYVMGIRR